MAETVAVIRDFMIIIAGILDIVLLAVLVIMVLQIWRLIRLIQREVPSLVDTTKQTMVTVKGTTEFVGATVARPTIRAAGVLSAAGRFVQVMTSVRRRPREGS